jgi:hypothetical protein
MKLNLSAGWFNQDSMVLLDHPKLEPFESLVRHILGTLFSLPTFAPPSAKLIAKWAPDNRLERALRETVAAYRAGQGSLANAILSIDDAIRDPEVLATRRRSRRCTDGAQGEPILYEVLVRRQYALRRICDALAVIACNRQGWLVRRLALDGNVRRLDHDVILRMLALSSELSAANPYAFYVVSDLTTFVQIGDLIEMIYDRGGEQHVRILEVKEGVINDRLGSLLAAATDLDATLVRIRSTMGEKAGQQAQRMHRQAQRLTQVGALMSTKRGGDPRNIAQAIHRVGKEETPSAISLNSKS